MKLRSQPPLHTPPCGRLRLNSWLKPRRTRRHKSRQGRRGAEPPPVANERSLFLFTDDWNAGCLIYSVHLESVPLADGSPALEILRPSADPVARWSHDEHKLSDFAAVSGGTIVALVAGSRGTVIRDTATGADAPGPRLRRPKRRPAMLPVGDDAVLVMDTDVRPGRCCFEALRRVPGGEWRAEPLPNPPVDEDSDPCVTAYFARGSRAWISLSECGTFSLDTELGTWRMEGAWELPLYGRGLFVPELGSVFGITKSFQHSDPGDRRCCRVCALDVEAGRAPVARRVWEIPPERVEEFMWSETVSLAHLGNGRFCISRSIVVEVPITGDEERTWRQRGTSFTLVDVTRLPGGDELARQARQGQHSRLALLA